MRSRYGFHAYLLIGSIAMGCGGGSAEAPGPKTPSPQATAYPVGETSKGTAPILAPPAPPSQVEVTLCDGQTKVSVPPGTSGTSISSALMAEWLRKNPNANWEAEERERHALQPAAENKELVGEIQGQTYGRVTEQDVALWKAETER